MCLCDDVRSSPTAVQDLGSGRIPKPNIRKVRFSDDPTMGHETATIQVEEHPIEKSSDLTPEEKEMVWYKPQEFHSFKESAKGIALMIRQEDSFDPARQFSYTSIIGRVYASCLQSTDGPSQRDQRALGHWVRVGHSRRGLERWSFPGMMRHRSKQRNASIQAVIRLQQASTNDSHGKAEFIRQAYQLHSQPLARLAVVFGEADAAAVRSEKDQSCQIDQLCRQKRRLSIGHVQRTAHVEPSTAKVC